MTPEEVVKTLETYAFPQIEAVVKGICPCLPIEALLKLAALLADQIFIKNELEAMQKAVQASDATVDVTEAEVLGGSI